MAKVEHSATLHVYGAPYVRPMVNMAAVAGKKLILNCPVFGYPIEGITWEKGKLEMIQFIQSITEIN